MKKLILGLMLLWPVAGLTDFQAGLEAAQRGDYATAMREWRPLAEAGDARAQNNLGMMYGNGVGVSQDYAKAVKWFRLAAEQGNAAGQDNLAYMYDKGYGVPEDFVQAYAWCNLAAAQGDKHAIKYKALIRKKMTHPQIAEAQKLRRELCAKIPGCVK